MDKPKRMVFKEYLVEKILSGMKTQTRRLVKDGETEPKYKAGDILYVPEAFCQTDDGRIHYRLNEPDARLHWQASLFMPMRYARIWLEVDEAFQQNVWNITDEDAACETGYKPDGKYISLRDSFAEIFEECYGEDAWEMNPLVWVVKFHRIPSQVGRMNWSNK